MEYTNITFISPSLSHFTEVLSPLDSLRRIQCYAAVIQYLTAESAPNSHKFIVMKNLAT